jgi:hypothetical protein
MPSKKDDDEQTKLKQQYTETGEVPEGWVLDAAGEAKGEPLFRKADGESEPAAEKSDE